MKPKEPNKQTKQKQTHTRREQTDGCQKEGGLGGRVRKVKGLGSTHWSLRNSHGDVKYSIGNTVSNIIITVWCASWALELSGETLCKVYDYLTTMLYT